MNIVPWDVVWIFILNSCIVHSSFCCPKIHLLWSLSSLWTELLYLTPVQLETAFRSIHLSQQEPVIAISYSQVTSAQPDESEEYFRCAALSLAASSAELLRVIICVIDSALLLDSRKRRAVAASLSGCWDWKSFVCVPCLRQGDLFTWPI